VYIYGSGHHHHFITGQVAQAKPRLGFAAGTPDRRNEEREKNRKKIQENRSFVNEGNIKKTIILCG